MGLAISALTGRNPTYSCAAAFIVELGPFFICTKQESERNGLLGLVWKTTSKPHWTPLRWIGAVTVRQTPSTNINAWLQRCSCVWKEGNAKPCETGSYYSNKQRTNFSHHAHGFDIKYSTSKHGYGIHIYLTQWLSTQERVSVRIQTWIINSTNGN